jgi:hypothetical protein
MATERNIYYTISFLVGILYLLVYALFWNYWGGAAFGYLIPLIGLGIDGVLTIGLLIKDILDERSIRKGGSPVGPTYFEHAPFAFMLAIHLLVILSMETDQLILTIELVFLVILLFDLILDITQDLRSKHHR